MDQPRGKTKRERPSSCRSPFGFAANHVKLVALKSDMGSGMA
ncbi:hypothetical protein V6U71_00320 [Sphingopyxis sp. J-6]